MLKKESQILLIFVKEPWRKFTFTEIKIISKNNSRSYVDSALKNFIREKLIKREKIGKIPIYTLNISSEKTAIYSGFLLENEAWNRKNIPYRDMEKFIKNSPLKNYVFLITGSYANNTEKNTSDIDVVIIIDDNVDIRNIRAALSQKAELNIPQIHLYIFRNKEFLEMLTNKEPNYGKEIVFNNIILSGGQVYVRLIKEAMDHGFTGKNTY